MVNRGCSASYYARMSGIPYNKVRRMLRDGGIKGQKVDGRWYVDSSELETLLTRKALEARGESRPKKERAKAAAIRWVWTFVFPGIGFALDWITDFDKLIGFGLSVPIALAVGATLYSIKKYKWPDTTW